MEGLEVPVIRIIPNLSKEAAATATVPRVRNLLDVLCIAVRQVNLIISLLGLYCAVDHDEVVRTAQNHGSGDSSMYSSAMSYVQQNQVRHHSFRHYVLVSAFNARNLGKHRASTITP
jgi:hypothetical protein